MFFLGAGFMLIETKAVVQMALLFGGTWIVNSIVFCAVLAMILVANLFVLAVRPRSLTPFYVGLALSLVASAVVPLDAFLGLSRGAADRRLVPAGVHADPLRGRDLRGVVQPRRRSPTARSARTSPARWSAACPSTARCCWAFSTSCWWRWPSTSSPGSPRYGNRSRGRRSANRTALPASRRCDPPRGVQNTGSA